MPHQRDRVEIIGGGAYTAVAAVAAPKRNSGAAKRYFCPPPLYDACNDFYLFVHKSRSEQRLNSVTILHIH